MKECKLRSLKTLSENHTTRPLEPFPNVFLKLLYILIKLKAGAFTEGIEPQVYRTLRTEKVGFQKKEKKKKGVTPPKLGY